MFLSYFRAALRLFPGCCFDYIMIFAKRKECFFVILHLCTISTKQCWFIRVFIAQKRHLYSKTQQKATRGRSMKARPTQSRKGVKGQLPPCRVKGQRPLWGLGQRPNCSASNLLKGSSQQRCRQRSVPASNFARPQTRPQVAHSTNCAVSRQMGATVLLVGKSKLVFIASRGFRLCGGESGALRSPPTPLRSAHPCFLVFIVAGDFASAEATKGHENRRMSAVALWKPSAPPLLGLIHLDDNRKR